VTRNERGDRIAHATKITPEGSRRLCEAAGITPPQWEDREWPEDEMRQQTKSLTGRDFDDIISERDILSRRPYLCASCGGTFTVDEYFRIQLSTNLNDKDNPFESNSAIHESCGGIYPIDSIPSRSVRHVFRADYPE
jgi:hypothetical protein